MQKYRIKITHNEDGSKTFWPQHLSGIKWNGFDTKFKKRHDGDCEEDDLKDVSSWNSSGGHGFSSKMCALAVIKFYQSKLSQLAAIPDDEYIYL